MREVTRQGAGTEDAGATDLKSAADLKSAIESILFVHGEPLESRRIAKLAGAPKRAVEAALDELAAAYQGRGIMLIRNGEAWQLATNPANKAIVEQLVASELAGELTTPALEALAIIAYKGPLSRAAVEYTRGVNSAYTLQNLLLRGLVERSENPRDRRSYLYRISIELIKRLGIARPEELPRYGEFQGHPLPDAAAAEEATGGRGDRAPA